MNVKTISILGTGWLGLPLAEHFLALGYRVKGSTTSAGRIDELTRLNIDPYLVNISDSSEVSPKFLDCDILIVNITSKDVPGFKSLVRSVSSSRVQSVVFVSSTSVYSSSDSVVVENNENLNSSSALLLIEGLFTSSQSFNTTIIRFAGLIGYRRNPALFFKSGRLVAGADGYVNLIHRDDCINILSLIVSKGIWGEVYNGCADTHPTKKEFYTYAAKSSGVPAPNFDEASRIPYKIVSNQKLKQDLDYSFVHPDLMAIDFSVTGGVK